MSPPNLTGKDQRHYDDPQTEDLKTLLETKLSYNLTFGPELEPRLTLQALGTLFPDNDTESAFQSMRDSARIQYDIYQSTLATYGHNKTREDSYKRSINALVNKALSILLNRLRQVFLAQELKRNTKSSLLLLTAILYPNADPSLTKLLIQNPQAICYKEGMSPLSGLVDYGYERKEVIIPKLSTQNFFDQPRAQLTAVWQVSKDIFSFNWDTYVDEARASGKLCSIHCKFSQDIPHTVQYTNLDTMLVQLLRPVLEQQRVLSGTSREITRWCEVPIICGIDNSRVELLEELIEKKELDMNLVKLRAEAKKEDAIRKLRAIGCFFIGEEMLGKVPRNNSVYDIIAWTSKTFDWLKNYHHDMPKYLEAAYWQTDLLHLPIRLAEKNLASYGGFPPYIFEYYDDTSLVPPSGNIIPPIKGPMIFTGYFTGEPINNELMSIKPASSLMRSNVIAPPYNLTIGSLIAHMRFPTGTNKDYFDADFINKMLEAYSAKQPRTIETMGTMSKPTNQVSKSLNSLVTKINSGAYTLDTSHAALFLAIMYETDLTKNGNRVILPKGTVKRLRMKESNLKLLSVLIPAFAQLGWDLITNTFRRVPSDFILSKVAMIGSEDEPVLTILNTMFKVSNVTSFNPALSSLKTVRTGLGSNTKRGNIEEQTSYFGTGYVVLCDIEQPWYDESSNLTPEEHLNRERRTLVSRLVRFASEAKMLIMKVSFAMQINLIIRDARVRAPNLKFMVATPSMCSTVGSEVYLIVWTKGDLDMVTYESNDQAYYSNELLLIMNAYDNYVLLPDSPIGGDYVYDPYEQSRSNVLLNPYRRDDTFQKEELLELPKIYTVSCDDSEFEEALARMKAICREVEVVRGNYSADRQRIFMCGTACPSQFLMSGRADSWRKQDLVGHVQTINSIPVASSFSSNPVSIIPSNILHNEGSRLVMREIIRRELGAMAPTQMALWIIGGRNYADVPSHASFTNITIFDKVGNQPNINSTYRIVRVLRNYNYNLINPNTYVMDYHALTAPITDINGVTRSPTKEQMLAKIDSMAKIINDSQPDDRKFFMFALYQLEQVGMVIYSGHEPFMDIKVETDGAAFGQDYDVVPFIKQSEIDAFATKYTDLQIQYGRVPSHFTKSAAMFLGGTMGPTYRRDMEIRDELSVIVCMSRKP